MDGMGEILFYCFAMDLDLQAVLHLSRGRLALRQPLPGRPAQQPYCICTVHVRYMSEALTQLPVWGIM
jgi:hypothetical protein